MAQENNKREKIQVEAMVFAAGTAVFMVCLERGILVFSFFEQWRVLVFLALNLLLLAILFTSKSQIFSSSDETNQEPISPDDHKEPIFSPDGHQKAAKLEDLKSVECVDADEVEEKDIGEVEEELSMEELNERVEAFIAMFRQHLASDGMDKSSRKAGDEDNNVYKCRAAAGGSNFRTCCFEGYSSLSATTGLRTVRS